MNTLRMGTRWIAVLGLAIGVMGCGPGGNAGATGPTGTGPAATGAGVPGGSKLTFCEAAAELEVPMNRAEIQAGLEANTPAGLQASVAVVREWMERQARGDNPYQDPDFLDEYDKAFDAIRAHCGIG